MNILEVNQVSKQFGTNRVIDNLSFSVKPNSVYGFLGQNGAGKTTVMKMILGLHKIDGGTIKVCGQQVTFGQNQTNKSIGYLADVPAFYDFMSAREYLKLCANISNISKLESQIDSLLELVGLEDNKQKIGGYSRGMRQRLGIASALLSKPKLLICDEPTSALDPIGRKQILDILKDAAKSTTIIFSTHILTDVERICDHVGILDSGKLVIDTDINTLTSKFSNHNILIEFNTESELNAYLKYHRPQIVSTTDCTAVISDQTLEAVYAVFTTIELYPIKIELQKPSLESIFLEVTND